MRASALIPKAVALAATVLGIATLTVLALLRPALPHVSSLSAPLTSTSIERGALCLAWLLAVLLALLTIARATQTLLHRSMPLPIPLREPQSSALHQDRPSPLVNPPYVLTIRAPLAPEPSTHVHVDTPAVVQVATEEKPGQVSVSVLGSFAIAGVAAKIRRAATNELIAYLALQPHGGTRDELIEAIWPDQDPQKTRPRFWQSVTEAHKALGDAWIHDTDRYTLDRSKIHIDLDELERLLAITDHDHEPAALEQAAALWRGEPLAGSDYAWADGHIRRLHATFLDLLTRVGHTRLANNQPQGALHAAEQAIALDPLHEPSWRLALQAEHALGLRSSVARRYEQLAQTLDQELGLQPSHETRLIYRQILGQN
jgi:DNA-binding SARP family transcriptional activator